MSVDNKEYANKLKEVLKAKGYDIKLGEVYDSLAEVMGYKNHHVAKANDANLVKVCTMSDFGGSSRQISADGKYDYYLTIATEAIVTSSLNVKADNADEAFKKVKHYLDENTNHIFDDPEAWESSRISTEYRITEIQNESIELTNNTSYGQFTERLTYQVEDMDTDTLLDVDWMVAKEKDYDLS